MPVSVKTFIPGIKVVPGEDWEWGDQNEGNVGEMIEKCEHEGWIRVKWEKDNYTDSYRIGIGNDDESDLYFADDRDALLQEAMERFPSGCSYIALNDDIHVNENVEYEYPYFWRSDKSEIALKAGRGLVYKKGKWAIRTDVKETKVEVFPGIYVGDVVVSLNTVNSFINTGDLFVVLPNSNNPSYWRIATQEEKEFYNNGGRNVNDMKASLTPDELLIAEAIKRYPVGTKFYPIHVPINDKDYCIITKDSEFIIDDGQIYSTINGMKWENSQDKKYGTTCYNRMIYCKKKGWAKIVDEKITQEELSPLEKCKQMYSAGDLVEAFDNKGKELSRMLLTQSGLEKLQVYKGYGGSVSYPGLAGYLYCSHNNKYARIIEKQPIFNNQSNTNQNGNETKEAKQSINSTISKSITRKRNQNTDSDNNDNREPIEVRRVSASITSGDKRGTTPISGRKCKTQLAIGHLSN